MKRKNKLKSKAASKNKQFKKELAGKLALAFNEIVAGYGKAKKADKVIEKFTKQLAKKITLTIQDSQVAVEDVKAEEELHPVTKEKAQKVVVKKAKAPVKESAE